MTDLWPITRRWSITKDKESKTEVYTNDLCSSPVVCLLGAAGLGKTSEMRVLYETEQKRHTNVSHVNLADIASDSSALTEHLAGLCRKLPHDGVLLIDSLDEAMVPVPQAATVLSNWIRNYLRPDVSLRLACRSTVWPGFLLSCLSSVYGSESVVVAELLPLDDTDILAAAKAEGIDSRGFINEIARSGTQTLASRPLTLKMLFDEFRSIKKIAGGGRAELFERAIRRLLDDSRERHERRTSTIKNVDQYNKYAQNVAALTICAGRECIQRRGINKELPGCVQIDLIETIAYGMQDPDKLFETGLFSTVGADRFRFIHRQLAEFLAAQRIAQLSSPQIRSILRHGSEGKPTIAGPLQETAAWIASFDAKMADWIAQIEPELIGHSEVANESLRRKAFLSVADMYREGKLTESQLHQDEVLLVGFSFSGIEKELRTLLRRPEEGLTDVYAFAIAVAEKNLVKRVNKDLADIAIDSNWPIATRKLAAHAVITLGKSEGINALRDLVHGSIEDSRDDLKGIALQALWSQWVADPACTALLTPPKAANYFGPYKYFLILLAEGQLAIPTANIESLQWATEVCSEVTADSYLRRIAGSIGYKALEEYRKPEICAALVKYIVCCSRSGFEPFYLFRPEKESSLSNDIESIAARFENDHELRRTIISELCDRNADDLAYVQAMRSTPGLFWTEDFNWLLEKAKTVTNRASTNFARIASYLPWIDSAECLKSLFNYLEVPVIAEHFPPLFIVLDSDEAERQKRYYEMQRSAETPTRPKLDKTQLILRLLERSEENPRWFPKLCQALSTDEIGHLRYDRFVTATEGWSLCDKDRRTRIANVARRLVSECTDLADKVINLDLSTIPVCGVIEAFFLLAELDSTYLSSLDDSVWRVWAWYIIREIRFRLGREPISPKKSLMHMLVSKQPCLVIQKVEKLARTAAAENTLSSVLEALGDIKFEPLDTSLCLLISNSTVRRKNLGIIMQFALQRAKDEAAKQCLPLLSCNGSGRVSSRVILSAVNLLRHGPTSGIEPVLSMLGNCPRVSEKVLAELAYSPGTEIDWYSRFSTQQKGSILQLLFESYPPKDDPNRDGAHFVGPEDSAIFLRQRLLADLATQGSIEAVTALREIETKYSTEYPWLRFSRADEEWNERRVAWNPLKPKEIVWILRDESARFIRSASDLLDIVLDALKLFQGRLSGTPPLAQNLWNLPRGSPPSPKEEEAVSDNLLSVIQERLNDYTAVAIREAQLQRRLIAKRLEGEPGQKTDILVEATNEEAGGMPLHLVVEVKNSYNRECKTALREQLVNRYLASHGWTHGIFVVAYLDAPGNQYKPVWKSLEESRIDLDKQAEAVNDEMEGICVKAVVLDASIR